MKIESKFEIDQEVFFISDEDVYDGVIESICVYKSETFEIFYIIDGDEIPETEVFTDIKSAVNAVTKQFKQKVVRNFIPKLVKSGPHFVEYENEDIDFDE